MTMPSRSLALTAAAAVGASLLIALPSAQASHDTGELDLTFLGRFQTGIVDEGASEITAYDARTRQVFVINAQAGTTDILDISDPRKPQRTGTLSTPGANSVAVHKGLVAVAQQAEVKTDPGTVSFFRASDGRLLKRVTAGALPDAVTFSPDGRRAVVSNEGEPDSYCADGTDPKGSISIVDLSRGVHRAVVRNAGFEAWDGREDALRAAGVRITGPGASASQDLEPEYAAVAKDGRTAWVTLQDNNAIATVDLRSAKVTKLTTAGLKDHSKPGAGLDPTDRDGGINIAAQPVKGMYQPDSIAAFSSRGRDYTVTANEGDARDYDCYGDEARVKDLTLSPEVFPDAAALQQDTALGRLNVAADSPVDAQGRVTGLHSFGARSVSVRDASGKVIWDSGDDLEQLTAGLYPKTFNSNHGSVSFDKRSDAKGPEPEGITTGTVKGRTYAFAGLERIGGIVAYDITDPRNAQRAGYVNSRDFAGDADAGTAGDLGPEGVLFIPAKDSPTHRPLLVVGHEVSGTTAVYEIG